MATVFVSRHPGAREWAARQRLVVDAFVPHLDPGSVSDGDTVIGILPVHIAAQVCDRGGQYLNLSLDLPETARGRELSADELESLGARLECYRVERTSIEGFLSQ